MESAQQASQNGHYNTGTSADADGNRVGARFAFMEGGHKMKKAAILLCALVLAGAGIAGARPDAGYGIECTSAATEQRPLCAATEPPTAIADSVTSPLTDNIPVEKIALQKSGSLPETEGTTRAAPEASASSQTTRRSSEGSADPYHTDVYPNNVYSEEFLYAGDGYLFGKTVTIPTEFGPDTIWIDGRAYYDVPDFGLVEWSGPGQRTEAYDMYENGNKVGIMGGDEDAKAKASPPSELDDWPEPTGEVIDQTINEIPEKNSTPPDYKPDTTPPENEQ